MYRQGGVHVGHVPAEFTVGPCVTVGPGEMGIPAWGLGAGLGDGPSTIDLDFTICETYRPDKEGTLPLAYRPTHCPMC